MLLIPEERHIRPLTALWQTVFGDAPDYIALFFDGVWRQSKTFAAVQDGQLVSALYLLDGCIRLDGSVYRGGYLYAAATLPAFRGRGLMGALVREAQCLAARQGMDFIALVPANDGLYDYYARFGFVPAMRRFVGPTDASGPCTLHPIGAQAYYEASKTLAPDGFFWTRTNHAYALACLAKEGILPFAGDGGVLLTDGKTVAEALAPDPRRLRTLLDASGIAGADAAVPLALEGFAPQRFGMVWTPDEALKTALQTKKIYMNLALD